MFIGLMSITTILPPIAKLLADTFESFGFLSSLLGEFPFHHWTLYYHPLLNREVKSNWPEGLHYPTIVYEDKGATSERLLLDSTIEPMNISGLVLHFIPTLLRTDDKNTRRDLLEFLVNFLQLKIEYKQEHGDYSVSRRYLGHLSFPTANTQVEPPDDVAIDAIEEVNIYFVPWPDNLGDFDLTEIDWRDTTDARAMRVSSYSVNRDGSVRETMFKPTTDT